MLRFASLHCAGRSASVRAHAYKLGFLPVAEKGRGSSAASQRLSARV
jgi:hypothetical protein